jgi:hypothetical protein
VRLGAPDHIEIGVRDGLTISLGDLRQHALRTAHGQKIAYVVDLAYNKSNVEKVVALAREADQLFIEAPFLDEDSEIASERRHLTARQAGEIAKQARVRRLIPFHFSARYHGRSTAPKLRTSASPSQAGRHGNSQVRACCLATACPISISTPQRLTTFFVCAGWRSENAISWAHRRYKTAPAARHPRESGQVHREAFEIGERAVC